MIKNHTFHTHNTIKSKETFWRALGKMSIRRI